MSLRRRRKCRRTTRAISSTRFRMRRIRSNKQKYIYEVLHRLEKGKYCRKKEGGDVEMETRGGGDELGRSGSLHRRGLCMQYVYADNGNRLGESADRPAAGRDIFSPFATDCQFVRTSSHSRIPAEIFFWITSNFCLVSSSPRPVHSPAHQYLELSSTLPSNYRTQIGACRAVSNSFPSTRTCF